MTSIISWIPVFILLLDATVMSHLFKTDIHLTAFDRLVYREIQLIALTLMTQSPSTWAEIDH